MLRLGQELRMVRRSQPLLVDPIDANGAFILGTGPPPAPSDRNAPTKRRPRGVLLAVVALVVLSAAVSLWFVHGSLHSNTAERQAPVDPPVVRTNYCTATAATSSSAAQYAELDPE